jgi:hypothetical protein
MKIIQGKRNKTTKKNQNSKESIKTTEAHS